MKKLFPLWFLLVSAVLLAAACGSSGDDDDSGDDDLSPVDDDASADDDDDNDNDDNDDNDNDNDNDDNDDDTPDPLCAERIAQSFECLWVLPGAENPLTEEEAVADCQSPAIYTAVEWDCLLDCMGQLADDCSNAVEDYVCIPLCIFHDGEVPDPDTCEPAFPDFRVCAHRGSQMFAPENTIPAFEYAIGFGANIVEVDVRSTADGYLVLMHDDTVDRTTNGTGLVEEMTLEEIEELLIDGSEFGDLYPDLHVPTFAEALATMKGHAWVDIDVKTDDLQQIVDEVNDADMHDEVMAFCSGFTEVDGFLAIDPTFPVMPRASTPEEVQTIVDTYDPPFVEIDNGCSDPTSIALIHGDGAAAFIDTLGNEDVRALFGDLTGWYDLMVSGIDIIQTDMTHMLVPFVATLCAN